MIGRLWTRARYVATTGARRRLRDVVLGSQADSTFVAREDLARRYLTGEGLEIGAAHWPLRVPPGVRVRYVDHLSREGLIEASAADMEIQGLDPASIPETDVIDDASRLATVRDGSVDFVIANHVLEHLEDPVAALINLTRALRPGGVLFISLPDARRSFDAARRRTTVEHLLRDHREAPEVSRREHYREWAQFIEGVGPEGVEARADAFARADARHHFHVWGLEDFLELLRALELGCELELGQVNQREFVVVLRRLQRPATEDT